MPGRYCVDEVVDEIMRLRSSRADKLLYLRFYESVEEGDVFDGGQVDVCEKKVIGGEWRHEGRCRNQRL